MRGVLGVERPTPDALHVGRRDVGDRGLLFESEIPNEMDDMLRPSGFAVQKTPAVFKPATRDTAVRRCHCLVAARAHCTLTRVANANSARLNHRTGFGRLFGTAMVVTWRRCSFDARRHLVLVVQKLRWGPLRVFVLCAARGLVQAHGGADQGLEGVLVDRFAFADIDGSAGVALEAGVEEA